MKRMIGIWIACVIVATVTSGKAQAELILGELQEEAVVLSTDLSELAADLAGLSSEINEAKLEFPDYPNEPVLSAGFSHFAKTVATLSKYRSDWERALAITIAKLNILVEPVSQGELELLSESLAVLSVSIADLRDNVSETELDFGDFVASARTAAAVPEPSTYAGLLGITCVSLVAYGWRRKRQQAA